MHELWQLKDAMLISNEMIVIVHVIPVMSIQMNLAAKRLCNACRNALHRIVVFFNDVSRCFNNIAVMLTQEGIDDKVTLHLAYWYPFQSMSIKMV